MARGKMRGRLKQWGRCRLHGQNCVLTSEIREGSQTRAQEKRQWRKGAA